MQETLLTFPVTSVLLGINTGVHVASLCGIRMERGFYVPAYVLFRKEYYRLVTSHFIHSGVSHLLGNVIGIWKIGPSLENILGSGKFVGLVVFSMIC
eukprot:TRINITY_DN4187_c0_g1_i4.p1 TRINITY_DN4187_c0_g1~~TRINITY_DN4187_c0_g1_i4.p1  ORF type:complete len:109 (+),score=15.57 TRINITY_DN4187_c0_g1_i4:37-327(+)